MKNYLKPIAAHEIFHMVKFVVNENFSHHKSDTQIQHYTSELNSVYNEELTYCQNSKVYVERDNQGSILGTIRVMKWNYVDPLPLQKIFGINPLDYIDLGKVQDVFHFGRLAIRKDGPSLQLFKKLIATAIIPVCQSRHNVAFAECDTKLFRILTLLGIKMKIIGESIHYLGSETIPVLIHYDGLIGFHLQQQKQLDTRMVLTEGHIHSNKIAAGG